MRKLSIALVMGLILLAGRQASAQSFEVGVELAQDAYEGAPGTTFKFEVGLTVTSSGIDVAEGPQGWSLGLANTGIDIDLTAETGGVTVQGTIAAPVTADPPGIFNGGFDVTQVIDPERNGGQQGVISAIVLSFVMPITLPPNQTDVVAIASYMATVGDEDSEASLEFRDGLVGDGQPVDNNVTLEGNSFAPTLTTATISIKVVRDPEICDDGIDNNDNGLVDCDDPDCAEEPRCLPETECNDGIDNDEDGLIDCDDDDCPACPKGGYSLIVDAEGAEGGVLEIEATDGSAFGATLFLGPTTDKIPSDGAQGWSLGVGHDEALVQATDVTLQGTAAADVNDDPPGLRNGGFEKSEVVDPDRNEGDGGVVSAVVLSFTMPITLDPAVTSPILRISYEVAAGAGGEDFEATLAFRDGLRGGGQPVDTVLTVLGETVEASAFVPLRIVAGEPVVDQDFVRGDANDDGRVNIADPIWIINELFRDGPSTTCPDAADATDDGMLDLADAMFLIEYRFLAGALPAAPFPDCGVDPTKDEVSCDPGSFSSCP